MPSAQSAERWRHTHVFDEGNPLAERNTLWAVVLTALMMVAEIFGGWWYNSMALLADVWHMSSHALALGLSMLAYGAARSFAHDTRFAFGTLKIVVVDAATSVLAIMALTGGKYLGANWLDPAMGIVGAGLVAV